MVNSDNKNKQIYKIIWADHFLSWLGLSKNNQINWTPKIDKKCKNQNWGLIKKSDGKKPPNKQELFPRPHLLPFAFIYRKKGQDLP